MSVELAFENLNRAFTDGNCAIAVLYGEAGNDTEKMIAINEADEILSNANTKAMQILRTALLTDYQNP